MLQITHRPNALPLAVEIARQHVKQDIDADDNLLKIYIGAAASFAEQQIERPLLATGYRLRLDSFPGPSQVGVPFGVPYSTPANAIQLPRCPLLGVRSVNYLDMAGSPQVMPTADYVIDDTGPMPRIAPCFGKIWPIPKPQIGAVWVDFYAGYASKIQLDSDGQTLRHDRWQPLTAGDSVRFSNSGGALPSPLLPGIDYIVYSAGSGWIKVADANGQPLTLTGGTGISYQGEIPDGIISWLLLRVDSLYVHRGETAITQGTLTPLPYVDRLLDPYRTVLM